MKYIRIPFAMLVFAFSAGVAPAELPKIPTMGFAGVLDVHSVAASDNKVVFVVSGPCELLLAKDSTGNAQQVSSVVDHAAVVLYRTHRVFPTDKSWNAECVRVTGLVGKGIYFITADEHLTWEDGDLTLVVTDSLTVKQSQ
jgi:hypothetical protein